MIIFNLGRNNQLLPEAARAFIRHAFDIFYRDFTLVETADRKFVPTYAYHEALLSFRTRPSSTTHQHYNGDPKRVTRPDMHLHMQSLIKSCGVVLPFLFGFGIIAVLPTKFRQGPLPPTLKPSPASLIAGAAG